MKRFVLNIFVVFAIVAIWQSCIDDDSVGYVREISKIDIKFENMEDSLCLEFGDTKTFTPIVTQSGSGHFTFTWRMGIKDSYGSIDSLKMLSKDSVLTYTFKELGIYKFRLQVTNEDGSSFYSFVVNVRTHYAQGLFILSQDEQGVGRTSFLRTEKKESVETAKPEDFELHLLEAVNPGISLKNVRDLWSNSTMYILADNGLTIHKYSMLSFDYLGEDKVNQEFPEAQIKNFCNRPNKGMGNNQLLLGEDGQMWSYNMASGLVLHDNMFSGESFDKVYLVDDGQAILADLETSRLKHVLMSRSPYYVFLSEYFAGQTIVNMMGDKDHKLYVVTTDPDNAQSVNITHFDNMTAGLFFPSGAFKNPEKISYTSDAPITLTRESIMVTNSKYGTTYYTRGGELYRWTMGTSNRLPVAADILHKFDGEITCLTVDANKEYLYIGVWNPAAPENLKGSVYVWKCAVLEEEMINELPGVADKPMKILYKGENTME